VAWQLLWLAHVARLQDQPERATALARESLQLLAGIGSWAGVADSLLLLACLQVTSDPNRAARLLGAVEGLREQMGAPVPLVERIGFERAIYDHAVAALRDQLGEVTLGDSRAGGRAMSLEQAVALA
jgi:hypothetical protein